MLEFSLNASLCRCKEKGVMVPVVMADITADGLPDILMTSFDGVFIAYNGDTFTKIWSYEDNLSESYT